MPGLDDDIEKGKAYENNENYADLFNGVKIDSSTPSNELTNLAKRAERRSSKAFTFFFKDIVLDKIDYYRSIVSDIDYNLYKRLAGEIEARAASNKLDVQDLRNALTSSFEDVPRKDVILMNNRGTMMFQPPLEDAHRMLNMRENSYQAAKRTCGSCTPTIR